MLKLTGVKKRGCCPMIVDPAFYVSSLRNIIQYNSIHPAEMETELHHYGK
jgi:hypothetical protein